MKYFEEDRDQFDPNHTDINGHNLFEFIMQKSTVNGMRIYIDIAKGHNVDIFKKYSFEYSSFGGLNRISKGSLWLHQIFTLNGMTWEAIFGNIKLALTKEIDISEQD